MPEADGLPAWQWCLCAAYPAMHPPVGSVITSGPASVIDICAPVLHLLGPNDAAVAEDSFLPTAARECTDSQHGLGYGVRGAVMVPDPSQAIRASGDALFSL